MFKKLAFSTMAAGIVASALALGSGAAVAAAFPERPVTLVVPWAAGGGSDILMRMLADAASGPLGQPIVVMNKPGAGGSIGLREVANSKPDGYTLGMMAAGFLAEQYNGPNAPKLKEFKSVIFTGNDAAVLAAGSKTGWNTISDLVSAAKAEPGKILNANDQPGGTGFVAEVLMENVLGIKLKRVPYAGSAPVVQALLSGETQTATPALVDLIEHHNAGRLKILAISSQNRHELAPDVPTFTELGYPLIWGTIRAVFAPAGTPDDVIATLEKAMLTALNSPELRERAKVAGFMLDPMGAKATDEFLAKTDNELYPVLQEAGLVRIPRK